MTMIAKKVTAAVHKENRSHEHAISTKYIVVAQLDTNRELKDGRFVPSASLNTNEGCT